MSVLRHLGGRVWLFPHDPDPARVQGCVAVIAGDDGSVLVDAGNSPAVARQVQAAVATAGLPAPRRLVYTHHHWDHVWGACAWPGLEIVGHRAGAAILRAEARKPWSEAYVREMAAANPRLAASCAARLSAMAGQWDDFAVRAPHTEFDDTLTLPGGVEVRHVGGGHAEDSTVVAVPDSGVLLLGDCFYPPPLHQRQPGDRLDLELVHRLLADYPPDRFGWYADSHDHPKPSTDLDDMFNEG
ncbi:MBL fold metallo-hydrolase [Actinoplanes sp. NPDC051633]|uniref:MBL fold metallo-hydrolase n=1 Tax=Actinoplanes sp. NPDC051633 TaxID=3155670 RepID=UPI003443C013